jgi:hypothetical protein
MKEHHKIWEQKIVTAMNSIGWNLTLSENEYEHYDAYGKTPKGFDCVIELKRRHKYYADKVMEVYKYEKLMEMECLKFYYVFDTRGNYLFLLDKLELPSSLLIQSGETTVFDKKNIIDKRVYFLSESKAIIKNII